MNRNPASDFDVVVVGAGPAGSATALRLARQGRKVALIERTCFEAARIGESLAPAVQPLLRELGMWESFMALAPLPSWGTRSVWGDAEPQSHSHLIQPWGCGWHVDRRALDQMLAHGAAASGAQLMLGTSLQSADHLGDRWRVQVGSAAVTQAMGARLIIDATGRRAKLGRLLGAQRLMFDRLVGVAMHWDHGAAGERGHLLVEASADGWWYSAPLPDPPDTDQRVDRMLAILMTDADLCSSERLSTLSVWLERRHAAPHTRKRLQGAHSLGNPRVHDAASHRLLRRAAPECGPWFAVGDAALSVDPVSGSGVPRALQAGRAAALAAQDMLDQPVQFASRLRHYEAEIDNDCTEYLTERAQYYDAERRFANAFWQRRHVLSKELQSSE